MSTAEVRRRYKRELAAAQPRLDEPLLPPARDDQRCDRCGIGTGYVWLTREGFWQKGGGACYRRCKPCEEATT